MEQVTSNHAKRKVQFVRIIVDVVYLKKKKKKNVKLGSSFYTIS